MSDVLPDAGEASDRDERATAADARLPDGDRSGTAGTGAESEATGSRRTLPASRAFVTWVELVAVGFAGSALSGATSGPPRLVVYLATTLVSVGVLFYNVDRLVRSRGV